MDTTVQESAYERAIRQLYERINYEKLGLGIYTDSHYRLDRTRKLLRCLGDPHLAVPVIHIAGTKGKGSTATFLSSLLTASGYRTGLYTSPHLVHLEERFRIDQRPCEQSEMLELVFAAQQAAEQVEAEGGGRATFFELTTAIAFLHFARQRVDAVVLEVGLGGRLDSTNVCQPETCVITSIGLDHQAQLGNTISAIAKEKAGIIKHRIPVVCSARHPDAREVFLQTARQHDCELYLIDRDFDCRWSARPIEADNTTQQDQATNSERASQGTGTNGRIDHAFAECNYLPSHKSLTCVGDSIWPMGMLGRHQADNLATALATVDVLAQRGWSIDRSKFASAILDTQVPARMQIVGSRPWKLLDTAHNPDSISAMISALDVHFPNSHRTIVFASSQDKDVASMLSSLIGNCDRLILNQYHCNPRRLPVEDLLKIAHQVAAQKQADHEVLARQTSIETASTCRDAWKLAEAKATSDSLLCATGSFFQAAELWDLLIPRSH